MSTIDQFAPDILMECNGALAVFGRPVWSVWPARHRPLALASKIVPVCDYERAARVAGYECRFSI